jgi:hypothetical protein
MARCTADLYKHRLYVLAPCAGRMPLATNEYSLIWLAQVICDHTPRSAPHSCQDRILSTIKISGQKDPSPCERSELTSLRVRYYRPRRAAGSPSAQRYTPLAPHIIDTALGSPLAPHPAGNSIKYRNNCVGLEEVGRRLTDCSYYQPPPQCSN